MRTYQHLNRTIAQLRRGLKVEPEVLEAARLSHQTFHEFTEENDRRQVLALLVLNADSPCLFPGGDEEREAWLEGCESNSFKVLFGVEQESHAETLQALLSTQVELGDVKDEVKTLTATVATIEAENEAYENRVTALQAELDTLKDPKALIADLTADLDRAKRSNAALKGQITKLKNAGAEVDPTDAPAPSEEDTNTTPSSDEGDSQ